MSENESLERNRIRLTHMLEAAKDAVAFAEGITLEKLGHDKLRALALTRCIEIIGEAAASVTQDFRDEHPTIPWRVIVATRNRLIHAYFDVDLKILHDTLANDLPNLIASPEKILGHQSL